MQHPCFTLFDNMFVGNKKKVVDTLIDDCTQKSLQKVATFCIWVYLSGYIRTVGGLLGLSYATKGLKKGSSYGFRKRGNFGIFYFFATYFSVLFDLFPLALTWFLIAVIRISTIQTIQVFWWRSRVRELRRHSSTRVLTQHRRFH